MFPCFSIYLIKCTFLINSLNTITRFGFVHIGRVGSAFATVTVTVERFIAVWYPLKKLRNTKILLSVPIVGSLIYCIPRFFEFKTSMVYHDGFSYYRYQNDTNSTNLTTVSYTRWKDTLFKISRLRLIMIWLCFIYKLLGNDIWRDRMAYKSKLRADLHSLDEAGTNRDHTIFHNYYSELLYSKKVS